MSKILYLGIDAPADAVHYPVIRTERIDTPQLREALAKQDQFSHWIFTSKNAVRHWYEEGSISRDQMAIAIGDATAKELQKKGIDPCLARSPTQEGVIAFLKMLDLQYAFICYPRSELARDDLACYLKQRGVSAVILDLYKTLYQKLEPIPDLEAFEEIVFTSPSTVEGFRRIFGNRCPRQKLRAIGPITFKALRQIFARSTCYMV